MEEQNSQYLPVLFRTPEHLWVRLPLIANVCDNSRLVITGFGFVYSLFGITLTWGEFPWLFFMVLDLNLCASLKREKPHAHRKLIVWK
ncbi:hypothetical protein L211DRAFT_832500 [Terfezia boudieri ATCC MYA-4762]|uniref:Uncharacterized protein n=1 Tax=Terfezia boudieri ATCC MYA-4762 TaxID=1051890 RepID=A0A3N4M433_9PEZI|nr:hypothetical protein L211DRAFT_832500 [Terfezia boudieri ATCC MYA-4762]